MKCSRGGQPAPKGDELRDLKMAERQVKAQELVAKVSDERRWLEFVKRVRSD